MLTKAGFIFKITLVIMSVFLWNLKGICQPLDRGKTEAGISLGSVAVDDEQWFRFNLRPEFSYKKFGIGLDLELFMDSDGDFSDKSWDFGSGSKSLNSVLRKIYYIRYSDPGERVHIRLGALEDVSLGYGFIMEGYRNTLRYPGVKKTGIQLELRGLSSSQFGLEFVLNDFQDLDRKGGLLGGRVAVKPSIGDLEAGFTFVMDINQYGGLGLSDGSFPADTRSADAFGMWGIDLGYPLVERKNLNLAVYGQYARNVDDVDENGDTIDTKMDTIDTIGWGWGAPGIRLKAGPLLAKVEYRHIENRFEPEYFNSLYEIERAVAGAQGVFTKEDSLRSADLDGVFGKISSNFSDVFGLSVSYQNLTGEEDAGDQRFLASAYVLPEMLAQIPRLNRAQVYYEKYNIDTDEAGFFERTPDTLFGYLVGFDIVDGLGVLVDAKFLHSLDEEGKIETEEVLNFQAHWNLF